MPGDPRRRGPDVDAKPRPRRDGWPNAKHRPPVEGWGTVRIPEFQGQVTPQSSGQNCRQAAARARRLGIPDAVRGLSVVVAREPTTDPAGPLMYLTELAVLLGQELQESTTAHESGPIVRTRQTVLILAP